MASVDGEDSQRIETLETTLNYDTDGSALSATDVKDALEYANRVAEMSSISDDAGRVLNVASGDSSSATVSQDALSILADNSTSLNVISQAGSLRYDKDALRGLSLTSVEVTVSMERDNVSELSDAQRSVVADSTFITVKAMAGDEYISDLGGTVAMSFVFENSRNWANFGAFYVTEEGETVSMPYSYDADTGLMSVYSTHHSVYAVLEVSEETETDGGSGIDTTFLIVAGCAVAAVIILGAVAYVRRS